MVIKSVKSRLLHFILLDPPNVQYMSNIVTHATETTFVDLEEVLEQMSREPTKSGFFPVLTRLHYHSLPACGPTQDNYFSQ